MSPKDTRKVRRTVVQILILILLGYGLITSLFQWNRYEPQQVQGSTQEDHGFIAISYFGVDRTGNESLISQERLDEHLKGLTQSGYVTITQQDILDYYRQGKPLPEKALFLMYEDGRRDTAIFAQPLMEKYNLKGTMLSYGDNMMDQYSKFLNWSQLIKLDKSSYWELGTNGYRLEYINTFNRYDHFIGQLTASQFSMMAPYLDRNYNHYLMDYIRDEYGIPMESYEEMEQRISNDYQALAEIYQKELGKVPSVHVLMHANTGQFGSNDRVSRVNERWITQLFPMNFNREGNSLNDRTHSIYDLTRIQPQSYWSTNHLLMRIWDDTKQEVQFVNGDEEKKKDWAELEGASEFVEDKIILTSMPQGTGTLRLNHPQPLQDIDLSVKLMGNKFGVQRIYLRADAALEQYIVIEVKNNMINVYEGKDGKEKEIFSADLAEHDGIIPQSISENKWEAEKQELMMKEQFATNPEERKEVSQQMAELQQQPVTTVAQGAEEYCPPIELRESGNRQLELTLQGQELTILVDGRELVQGLEVSVAEGGMVYLQSAWGEFGYSQRNLTDDVYDGVFEQLVISQYSQSSEEKIVVDHRLKGWQKFAERIKVRWDQLIDWFIHTF